MTNKQGECKAFALPGQGERTSNKTTIKRRTTFEARPGGCRQTLTGAKMEVGWRVMQEILCPRKNRSINFRKSLILISFSLKIIWLSGASPWTPIKSLKSYFLRILRYRAAFWLSMNGHEFTVNSKKFQLWIVNWEPLLFCNPCEQGITYCFSYCVAIYHGYQFVSE